MAALDTFEWHGWEIPQAFPTMVLALAVTLGAILAFWKELKIVSFDPALATAMGISAVLVHYLLMALVAAVTVTAFEAVGSILVVAMLVVPAATAHLLTDRLWLMMVWAAVIATIAAVLGYVLASEHVFNSIVSGMMAVVVGCNSCWRCCSRHGTVSWPERCATLGWRCASLAKTCWRCCSGRRRRGWSRRPDGRLALVAGVAVVAPSALGEPDRRRHPNFDRTGPVAGAVVGARSPFVGGVSWREFRFAAGPFARPGGTDGAFHRS